MTIETRALDATEALLTADAVRRLAKAVRKGTTWLDKTRSDWADDVHPGRLSMAAADFCVLGQMFGGYTDGLSTVHHTENWSIRHGFTIVNPSELSTLRSRTEWEILDAYWRAAILERKYASGQVDDDQLLRNTDNELIPTKATEAMALAQG